MIQLYNVIFYQPIYNLLVFFYNVIPGHDFALVVIVLTILIRLILLPFSWQQIKSQKVLQGIQPKLDELKEKYKDDKETMMKEQVKFFQENKINPFSSCLPTLIQLPFLIALYQVLMFGLNSNDFSLLYPFVSNPGHLSSISLGFFNLASPNAILAILAGAAQFWQSKMLITKRPPKVAGSKDEDMSAMINKQMLYMMPILTIVIGLSLPSGLALYWLVNTLLMIAQQYYIEIKAKKIKVDAN